MKKSILIINDMPGYGKVATAAMLPILSSLKFSVYNLPTALVSNTLDYGKFEIMKTTEYMEKTLEVWKELGFKFDFIATGFLIEKEQVELIKNCIHHLLEENGEVLVDPIMGDNHKLYNGVEKSTIKNMVSLSESADYIIPNFTEAKFMTNKFIDKKTVSKEELDIMIDELKKISNKSVIVTSVNLDDDSHLVSGYSKKEDENFYIPYEHIPKQLAGTGDMFSAVFIGEILKNKTVKEAVKRAMDIISYIIKDSYRFSDSKRGIAIEEYLDLINENL